MTAGMEPLERRRRASFFPRESRVSAATAILDRGWGKPLQALGKDDDRGLELIHRIERVIVDPENSNGAGL